MNFDSIVVDGIGDQLISNYGKSDMEIIRSKSFNSISLHCGEMQSTIFLLSNKIMVEIDNVRYDIMIKGLRNLTYSCSQLCFEMRKIYNINNITNFEIDYNGSRYNRLLPKYLGYFGGYQLKMNPLYKNIARSSKNVQIENNYQMLKFDDNLFGVDYRFGDYKFDRKIAFIISTILFHEPLF